MNVYVFWEIIFCCFAWLQENRTYRKVYEAFAHILEQRDLIVDIAGIGFHRPTEKVKFTCEEIRKQTQAGINLGHVPELIIDDGERGCLLFLYIQR